MANKPTLAEGLNRIWALTGTKTDPDSQETGKFANGWNQEMPRYEAMNYLQHYITKLIAHVISRGIPDWDTNTTYSVGSLAISTVTNQVYRSVANSNQGNEPSVSSSTWTLYRPGDPGILGSSDIVNNSTNPNITGANVTNALESLYNHFQSEVDDVAQSTSDELSDEITDVYVDLNALADVVGDNIDDIDTLRSDVDFQYDDITYFYDLKPSILRSVTATETIGYSGINSYDTISDLSSTSSTTNGIRINAGEEFRLTSNISLTLSSLVNDIPFNIRVSTVTSSQLLGEMRYKVLAGNDVQEGVVSVVSGNFTISLGASFVSGHSDFYIELSGALYNNSGASAYVRVQVARTTAQSPTNNTIINRGSWIEAKRGVN